MRSTSAPLLVGFSVLLASTLTAQGSCPGLSITAITWAPFDPDAIQISVTNASVDIFSYPSFILLNGADTVAMEQTNSFGIGGESIHRLDLHPTWTITNTFQGTVQLYTGFGETLACTFSLPVTLCPTSCQPFFAQLTDLSGGSAPGQFAFVISDADGAEAATGMFDLPEGTPFASVPVCLGPGPHTMLVSAPFSSATTLRFGVSDSGGSQGPSTLFVPDVQGTELAFSLYDRCQDIGNGLVDRTVEAPVQLTVVDGTLSIRSTHRAAIGTVRLLDMGGRMLLEQRISGTEATLSLEGPAPGCYLLVVGDGSFTQRIILH